MQVIILAQYCSLLCTQIINETFILVEYRNNKLKELPTNLEPGDQCIGSERTSNVQEDQCTDIARTPNGQALDDQCTDEVPRQANKEKEPNKTKSKKKLKTENEKRPNPALRFDEICHFPALSCKLFRCKNENCKQRTFTHCSKCKVHLCMVKNRNCFLDFHILKSDEEERYEKGRNKVKPAVRFDQKKHFPIFSRKISRCKNEDCDKKTHIFCSKCKVHLCIVKNRNCFLKFHFL